MAQQEATESKQAQRKTSNPAAVVVPSDFDIQEILDDEVMHERNLAYQLEVNMLKQQLCESKAPCEQLRVQLSERENQLGAEKEFKISEARRFCPM